MFKFNSTIVLYIVVSITFIKPAILNAAWLSEENKGTTAAAFLKIQNSAVPASMGGAYTALSRDISGIEVNPAGLAESKKREAEGMYILWFEDVSLNCFSYKNPAGPGVIAVSYKGLYTDDIEKRIGESDEPLDTFKARNHLAAAAYAYRRGKISVGLTGKYALLKLSDESASFFGVDTGVKYYSNRNLLFGAALKNIGTKVKFKKEAFAIPSEFSAGIAYIINEDMQIAADLNFPSDNEFNTSLGYEHTISFGKVSIPLRVGFKTLNEFKLKDSLSAGLGIGINDRYYFDTAWVPYGFLGDTFRISVKANF